MSQTPTPVQEPRGYSQASRDAAESGDSTIKFLDAALWERLSQSEAVTDLALAWLALLCRTIDGAQQALLLLEAADNVFETPAMWPEGAGKPQSLADTAKIALAERRGVIREGGAPSE